MTISSMRTTLKPGQCSSTTRPALPWVGQTIYETDTSRVLFWDGTGWIILYEPPQAWTPTFTGLTLGSGTTSATYQRANGKVILQGTFTYGAGSAIGSNASINNLPKAMLTVDRFTGTLWVLDANVGYLAGFLYPGANTSSVYIGSMNASTSTVTFQSWSSTIPMTWVSTDGFRFYMEYVMATPYT